VSALKHTGLDALREKIAQVLADSMEFVQVVIPYAKGELVELFHRRGHVDQEEHRPEGTFVSGRIPRSLQGYYSPYLDF
jgi:GTP-binding protein HflX